jgi:hypothetical protein
MAREARPARPEAVLGVGPGGGDPPSGRGFGGITPRKFLKFYVSKMHIRVVRFLFCAAYTQLNLI